MKSGERYKIPGYATIDVLDFCYVDVIAQWKAGKVGSKEIDNWIYGHDNSPSIEETTQKALKDAEVADSGETAEFALLKIDITNLQKTSICLWKTL